jgi:hypothetical protein
MGDYDNASWDLPWRCLRPKRATCLSVFKRFIYPDNLCRVTPEQRIRELCAQLLRAENPAVIEAVMAQLKYAIDRYNNREEGARDWREETVM